MKQMMRDWLKWYKEQSLQLIAALRKKLKRKVCRWTETEPTFLTLYQVYLILPLLSVYQVVIKTFILI
jgi:hypothetical protein